VVWFEAEHANLLAAQQLAAARDLHSAVWHLARNLSTFHIRRGLRDAELASWLAAESAVSRLPDPAARIRTQRLLGRAYADVGIHVKAIRHLREALRLAEHHHDLTDQAHSHRHLAWIWDQRGSSRRALHHVTHALNVYRTLEMPASEATTLNEMAVYAARRGDYDAARAHCQAALKLHRCHHDPVGEAAALGALGYVEHRSGHHDQAVQHYRHAQTLFDGSGDTFELADVLDQLGYPHAALGQREEARAAWLQALELYKEQRRSTDAVRVWRQLRTFDEQATVSGGRKRTGECTPAVATAPAGRRRETVMGCLMPGHP
jgi:tetratricopeptide (TPR) repeat protein